MVDDRAPVPTHVAWTGTRDRVRPSGDDAVARIEADERRAIASLAEAAVRIGVRWLTVQVTAGAAAMEPSVRRELGTRVVVQVLGAPWAARAALLPEPVLTVVLADGGLGRVEIVQAVSAMAADGVPQEALDEKVLAGYLFEPDMPDPDLVVVTGGDRRVPDLLTWEMAYSELVFLDIPWPAIERDHLAAAVDEYRHRNRRYGGIVPQARSGHTR
jgi:Putative undecaprenyl diphosphate synthase